MSEFTDNITTPFPALNLHSRSVDSRIWVSKRQGLG